MPVAPPQLLSPSWVQLPSRVRLQGALTMPEEVDPADEMFDPRRGPIYVRGDGAEARLRVLSWLPTRGVNKRLDYLRRLILAPALSGLADPPPVPVESAALPPLLDSPATSAVCLTVSPVRM